LQIERLDIPDVIVFTPKRFGDERGYFTEVFRADVMAEAAPGLAFVQDNQSGSAEAGTVRGLHFQANPHAQAKLVRVLKGAILDVAVDIRRGSPSYGRHVHRMLSAANGEQLLVPAGFAHGFCTLVPDTEVTYKVNAYYNAASDKGLAWDDPALGIPWPVLAGKAVLSAKDKLHPKLADLPAYFD
jgi:dTDP-4-dehydrorhamnose 3,5-epimerase